MIYFPDSTKVPFILSHAHHVHVLLFLPYTVLSQSVLLGLRFIHNSVFFPCPPTPPPFFCLEPLFSSFNYSLCSLYIARPERISSRSLFYCSTSIYVSSNHLYYGIILGLIPLLGSWDVKLLSWFPIKAVAVKCNPWLHFTLQ